MPPAGQVDIVFRVNKGSYSADVLEMKKKMDELAGAATGAGKSTVGANQAAAASFRALNDPLSLNIRTLARFATQSEVAGKIFQAAFPVVGAIAAVAMVAKLGMEVAAFVKKVEQMPRAITAGFAQLDLSQKTSLDSMNVLTDRLNNAHAVFEHKPTDGLKLGIDEAKESADKFAESVIATNAKVNELLSKNHLTGWAILMGRQGTGGVDKAQAEYTRKQDHNAYLYATAAPGSPEQAAAKKAMATTRSGYLDDRQRALADLNKNNEKHFYDNPIAANEGIIADLKREQESDGSVDAAEVAKKQAAVDEAKKKAREDAKTQDQKRLQALKEALDSEKIVNNISIKQQFDYWSQRISVFKQGSDAYRDVIKLQAGLAVDGAVKAHEELLNAAKSTKRGEISDSTTGIDILDNYSKATRADAVKDGKDQTEGYVDSNRLAIDQAQNQAKEREAKLADEAGNSISKYAAAVQLANVHAQEWKTTEIALTAILDARKQAQANDPSKENDKAVTDAQIALANAARQHTIQMQSDSDNIYGKNRSGSAGFSDAINDFVRASQDAAGQMRQLTDSTLKGLNAQLVAGMSGQNTDFKGFGAGVFRNVAGIGLEKAEGSILGAFGGGKAGSQNNPLWVRIAGAGGAVASTAGGFLKSILPFLASGGPIDGPAIVGENGPELYVPSSPGVIVPNHKLSSVGGGNSTSIAIDARGAGDPAQVRVAIHQAISEAAPHIMAGAVSLNRNINQRKPSSSAR